MALREKSAGIILFRRTEQGNKYLLLHYEAGHWDFVKGHIEEDESEKETAIRELKEETSITKFQLYPDFREKLSFFYKRDNKLIHKEVIYFLAETSEEKVRLTEHLEYKWLPFEQALNQTTFKNSQQILKKAKEHIRLQDSLKKLIRK